MKKYILLSVALLTFTVGCNNSDDNNIIDKQPQGLQFSFSEADYGEEEVLSRAETVQTEAIDFGDCEAEVSVENESVGKVLQTETRIISNKHYTIRAYQAGVRKGEIKGTFNGATFTPDAGSPKDIYVEPGSCDFVAFNDDVTPVGENLTVDESKMQTARIASFTTTIAAQKQQQVNFEMKHVCARLRTQFVCQKHMPNNITATLEETTPNAVPASVSYNPVTKAYTPVTTKSITPQANNSPASVQAKFTASNGGQTFAYTSTSNYHYFLPTAEGSKLKLTFNAGTIFWNPMSGIIPKLNATLIMQPNKSYVVKIKLKPKFTYLFSDGTTGFRSQTTYGGAPAATAKIPVGVVIEPNKKVAVGLKHFYYKWQIIGDYKQYNTNLAYDIQTLLSWENGYDETWNAANNTSNVSWGQSIPKGNHSGFPAFYNAGHYNPGVTLSGGLAGKLWYLPACGEWKYIFTTIAFGDIAALNALTYYGYVSCYSNLANEAFTQVGGVPMIGNNHWTSSQNHVAEAAQVAVNATNMNWNRHEWNKYGNHVRAFIRY